MLVSLHKVSFSFSCFVLANTIKLKSVSVSVREKRKDTVQRKDAVALFPGMALYVCKVSLPIDYSYSSKSKSKSAAYIL